MYDPKKPLISIHIPKCAGTSFTEVLEKWYGRGLKKHYHDEKLGRPPQRYKLYSRKIFKKRIPNLCIHGHFNRLRGNGDEDYYPNERQRITILRNPWELHVSTYFFVLRSFSEGTSGAVRDGNTNQIIKNNWTLDDYLVNQGKSYIANFFPDHLNSNNFKEVLEEHFLFIGVSEKLNESIKILAGMLDKPIVEAPIKNTAERFSEPTTKQKEIFYEQNQLEMDIYKYVFSQLDKTACYIPAKAQ